MKLAQHDALPRREKRSYWLSQLTNRKLKSRILTILGGDSNMDMVNLDNAIERRVRVSLICRVYRQHRLEITSFVHG